MDTKKCCSVNLQYLPIKAHYFFAFGAMAGTVPFMPVVAKNLGINATVVGLIYTAIPICVFLSKPLFGYLTDYFRNIKAILLAIVVVTAVTFLSVLSIPSFKDNTHHWEKVKVNCDNSTHQIIIEPLSFHSSCLTGKLKDGIKCNLASSCLNVSQRTDIKGMLIMESIAVNHSDMNHSSKTPKVSYVFIFSSTEKLDTGISCECLAKNLSTISCEADVFSCPSSGSSNSSKLYQSYLFWIFTFLSIISGTGASTMYCLSDAACYEVLVQNSKLYGRQRLWATISWGIITLLAGFLNDIATGSSEERNYSPGFYLMAIFAAVDILILWRVQLVKANISMNICKDVGKIFASFQTVVFAVGVYIAGGLSGLLWSYQFWYLEDMGASQTLLGLTVAVQCLVTEVPFFFFSGWFIKKLGHFYCLIGTFVAFTLRYGLYTILKDPWYTLPIEVLHGVTFAIFYSTMTSYATDYAPPGTEATMLGVLGGLFEGLGVATGSLLGGVGFDKLGGRQTFFAAGVISLISVPILFISLFSKNFFRAAERRTSTNS